MTLIQISPQLDDALQQELQKEYQRGLADGLKVADKIRGWLTRQPDTKRQRETREWADTTIANARTQGHK
jgi:hypothetical protein